MDLFRVADSRVLVHLCMCVVQGQQAATKSMNTKKVEQQAVSKSKDLSIPLEDRKASVLGTNVAFVGSDGQLKRPTSAKDGQEEKDDLRTLGKVRCSCVCVTGWGVVDGGWVAGLCVCVCKCVMLQCCGLVFCR